MLGDKDVPGVVGALRRSFDRWFAATSEGPRAIDADELRRRAATAGVAMEPVGPIAVAMHQASLAAGPGDRIVVFGSFHTVGPALAQLGVTL